MRWVLRGVGKGQVYFSHERGIAYGRFYWDLIPEIWPFPIYLVFLALRVIPLILWMTLWPIWPIKYNRCDTLLVPALGLKRYGSSIFVLWIEWLHVKKLRFSCQGHKDTEVCMFLLIPEMPSGVPDMSEATLYSTIQVCLPSQHHMKWRQSIPTEPCPSHAVMSKKMLVLF